MTMSYAHKKTVRLVYSAIALLVFLGALNNVAGNTYSSITIGKSLVVDAPAVTLHNLTANSVVYTNNTSAKVTISNGTTSLDVLEMLNQTGENWKLQLAKYDDNNISRLGNCTIWLHNGTTTSLQIKITDGEYNQASGGYYDLTSGVADRITITASTNSTGTSYVHTYLKILKPSTSTYTDYVITFQIND